MTTREIADLIKKMYGAHYRPQTISNMSQALEEQVYTFHHRRVQPHYCVLFLDVTWLNLRRDSVSKEVVHFLVGITPEGHKKVLDYAVFPTEAASDYHDILLPLKERGLEKVHLIVSDGLTGIRNACYEVFRDALHQTCWVHLSRTVTHMVRVKDRKEILDALKTVYQTSSDQVAKETLVAFLNQYGKRYPKLWKTFNQKSKSHSL